VIIGFSSTDAIISRIIKWFTRSKASHAYVLFEVAGEQLVIHSTEKGINCDCYRKFVKENKIVAEYKLLIDKDSDRRALAQAICMLDKPYDFLSVLGFGWVIFNRVIGRRIKNPFPNRSAYHCSEFALTMLRKAKLQDLEHLSRELTAPEDLIHALDVHPQAKEL
jgi:hypothetical protein